MLDDASTAVSIAGALVAALSAVYARWQARASLRANRISLHENRLSVYKGLVRFRAYLTARGAEIKEDEVWKFAEVAELSEFYFPPGVHERMESVFQQALKLLSVNAKWEHAKDSADRVKVQELIEARYQLQRETRDECLAIGNEIKGYLRVGEI